MTRPRGEWRRAAIPLAILVSGVIGTATLITVSDLSGQGTGKPSSPAAREPDLAADLDAAIRTVEQGDFATFLERYAPVDVLRRLRQQDLVERAAKVMAGQPQTKQQLLAVLKALQKQTPKFDKSRGLATLEFDPLVHGVDAIPGELHVPGTDELKLVGLGGDLNKVLAEATRLLAAGDFQTFVEGLFPASELARLREPDAMQDLVQQFKVATDSPKTTPPTSKPNPNQPIQDAPPTPKPISTTPPIPNRPTPNTNADTPNLLAALQADFKLLQTLTPELTDKGRVAVFRIDPKNQQPVRVIKFQKSGNDWRLFDNSDRVIDELRRQSNLRPRSAVTTVQLERIGGNWRFIELPALGLGAR